MQVSVETGEGLQRRMTVELSTDDVSSEVEKRLQDMSGNIRMDGFRPGKAPMRLLRQRYGHSVRQDVIGEMIQPTFFKAAHQENLKPAGMPTIDELDVGAARYVAVFEVLPEFELKGLDGVEIKRPQVNVADSDVDAMVARLRGQRATWETVERAAAMGDQITMDFVGKINGEAFEGGSGEDTPIVLGSNSLIDGFEEGLVGLSAGDQKNLELTFPDDYRAEHLAGQESVFEITVKSVQEKTLPELDEAFIKAFGVESGDQADFLADIRKNMEHELNQKVKSTVKERALDALLEKNTIDVPQALIDQEAEEVRNQTREKMRHQYSGHQGQLELPVDLFKEQAKRRVTLGLLVADIIETNEIKLDASRVQSTIEELAQTYADPQSVIDHYQKDEEARSSLESLVLEDQVVDWLLAQAKLEDESSSFENFMNPSQDQNPS